MSTTPSPTSQATGSPVNKTGRKLRILALHSFRTSAKIFQDQMRRSALDSSLQDLVDIVYIDAPNPASGKIPKDVAPYFEGPYYEWLTAEAMGDRVEFDESKIQRSHELVGQVLREQGPFDGLMGFSQGAMLASSIVAMQQHGTALQDVPRLRLCVLFAGIKSRYPAHTDAMAEKVPVPTLHIIGDRDKLREYSKELAATFSNAVVLLHQKGHIVPPLPQYQVNIVRAFLMSFLHTPRF